MFLQNSLTQFSQYLNEILTLAAHPQAGWNHVRRVFAQRLLLGLILAGDTMFTEIVRQFPNKQVAMKHRYKNADRMMGEIDLVPVAEQQMELLGKRMNSGRNRDWVIAVDISDIHKKYACKMEALGRVRDGSTGESNVPGYGLITAAAIDLNASEKVMPLPLLLTVYSPAEDDFKSQPAIWMDALDRLMDATQGGTFVIDSEADSNRFFDKFLLRKRHFVIRVDTGNSSRIVLFGKDSRARIRDAWEEAKVHGMLTVERISEDGTRSPYECQYASMPVRLPGHPETLYLCVFKNPDHQQPLAVLTDHVANTPEAVTRVLLLYFSRWVCEEMHRFAKVSFKLENVRFLTYRRLKNVVAMVWIAMGAIATYALSKLSERGLRILEHKSQRVRRGLTRSQFWGYAIVDGLQAWIEDAPRLLNLMRWLWTGPPPEESPQLGLFGTVK